MFFANDKGGRRVGRITSNGVKAKNGLTDMSPLQDSVGRHEARTSDEGCEYREDPSCRRNDRREEGGSEVNS